MNGYGLFRVMTKDRDEIVIEGSADGIDWVAYEFKWKPGDVMRAPVWCAPHQPRLDWQMWRIDCELAARLARCKPIAREEPFPARTATLHSRDVLSLSFHNVP